MRKRFKNITAILVLFIFGLSLGYAALSTTLSISGKATIQKKTWDATEVSYTTTKNSSVSNSKQAIEDLYNLLSE